MQTLNLADILQNKFIGTDDLRKDLSAILSGLSKKKAIVITQHGQPRGVLIDIKSYLEYEEYLEQVADSDPKLIKRINAAVADVKKHGGIPAEQVWKELGI